MPIWRSPELEMLFGGPLDATGVTLDAIERLVLEGASESEVIDFKQSVWPKAPKPRPPWTPEQELAKDVAAMANHRGGLLLVGVEEVGGVATAIKPFALATSTEVEERRLRQALVNYLAPQASCEFVWVEDPSGGLLLALVVPRSARSPHAVVVDGGSGLKYPIRHGTDTRWLTESEVAERYRVRGGAAAEHAKRVQEAVDDGVQALRDQAGTWLFAAAIPENPLLGRLDAQQLAEIEHWYRGPSLVSPLNRSLNAFGRGIAAPGRVTFTGAQVSGTEDEALVRDAYVELHVDGTAFAAAPTGFHTEEDGPHTDVGEFVLVDDGVLVVDVVVRWCATRVGAWGTADIVVGLVTPDQVVPIGLVGFGHGGRHRVSGSRSVTTPITSRTVADLVSVESVQQRMGVAQAALTGLVQAFGLAEISQFDRDGVVNARQFGMSNYRMVERWAGRFDVEVAR